MEKNMLNYIKFNLLIISICWSQVSVPSTPKSFYTNESIQISNIVLPSFDVEQFLIEDENELRSSDVKPYRFANPILVDLNMDNSGTWNQLDDGSLIWMLEIESTNAFSLNVFSQDLLEQFGEKLTEEIPDNNDSQESENN